MSGAVYLTNESLPNSLSCTRSTSCPQTKWLPCWHFLNESETAMYMLNLTYRGPLSFPNTTFRCFYAFSLSLCARLVVRLFFLVPVYLPEVRWVFLFLTMVTFIDSAHWLLPCFYCVIGLHCDKVVSPGVLCLDHQVSPVSEQRDCQFLSEVCAPCP